MYDKLSNKTRIIIIFMGALFFAAALFFAVLFYNGAADSGNGTESISPDTDSPFSETSQEKQASPMPDLQNYEGFLPIYLHADASANIPVDLKLYLDGTGNCFFFLPSYASAGDLQFQFDETLYSIAINGLPICPSDSLAVYDMGRQYSLSITSPDNRASASGTLSITFMQSQDLPAIFISTATGSLDYMHASREHREPGDFVCILPDGTKDSSGPLSTVRCHGNFSYLSVNKKSYQIYFESDTNVLSMGSATRYILQANALDITRMRNGIVYSYCRDIGIPYAVDTEYADLYFNGEYTGNYLLCERVELGADRVNLAPEGYLIEKMIAGRIKPDDQAFQVAGMNWFIVRDPSEVSDETLSEISDYMNQVETLIRSCDSLEKYEELSAYIDVDSFADMYLVNAITNDIDANIASTFYYLYDDGKGRRLYAGPIWDYDNSFGRNSRGYDVALNAYPSGYCEELYDIPYFCDKVAEKLNTSYYPLMEQYLTGYIPLLQEKLQPSVSMDLCRWEKEGYIPASNQGRDDAIPYLYDYIQMRLEYVRRYISYPEQYRRIRFVNSTAGADYRDLELWIEAGETLPDDIMEEMSDRFDCDGFRFGNGKPYANTGPVFRDMTLYSNQ